jgi:hypothetical protein
VCNDGLMLRTWLGPSNPGDGAKTSDDRQKETAAHAFPPFFFVIAGEPVCGKIQDLDKGSPELDKGSPAFFHILCDAAQHRAGCAQIAVAPEYRVKPLTPAYGNAVLYSARINF